MSRKTFFITGANSGFGLAIATAAAQMGHQVIGTVRSEIARSALAAAVPAIHPVLCDVTAFDQIPDVVRDTEDKHGPVDVLINNAGYGHEGVIEESPLEQMRRQFDVNVFGAVAVAKAFIPRFRERRQGFIVNVTSMGGMITMPGIGYYCGSKFALQGISEVMRSEMAPFGVHMTTLCPGSFRTDWAGRSMIRTERSIADYDSLFDPIREARQAVSGKQLGDPEKLAAAVLILVETDNPPPQLLLGSDALKHVSARLKRLQEEIDAWTSVTVSTDG
ncbi:MULTISPECIES: oxidoreductase [Rhizobium/Agrobacterium group]|uniref:Short-chain dehydrogenase protein n=2 Tax=Rhizobium/Agrobacterium group TaxID=227290 RepID=B9K4H6_ALLAM|nr:MULTISPECIES: oxidoreductase [Rhizobium/Agrobacterium group]ACM39774.1 short-chain dehydrogenase protein [Allorhizobium ampelinum S4]MCF1450320.1 oxidoreductase [Allorhizobium ampelinum]MUO31458.1 SDR family NAD(P)-dependent oxidoreductase [Agrobacterium vitis]MUO45246.1 SDR family NAD(P)-dependent oxidoreductase [Agrobacterium vitis]MUP13153.1 SDR family NAD(P)-dependent oxidoreductase [Agrobacterium vitis]